MALTAAKITHTCNSNGTGNLNVALGLYQMSGDGPSLNFKIKVSNLGDVLPASYGPINTATVTFPDKAAGNYLVQVVYDDGVDTVINPDESQIHNIDCVPANPGTGGCTLAITSVQVVTPADSTNGYTGSARVITTGGTGTKYYSPDNITWQTSEYLSVPVGGHTAYVKDSTTPNPCTDSEAFTMTGTSAPGLGYPFLKNITSACDTSQVPGQKGKINVTVVKNGATGEFRITRFKENGEVLQQKIYNAAEAADQTELTFDYLTDGDYSLFVSNPGLSQKSQAVSPIYPVNVNCIVVETPLPATCDLVPGAPVVTGNNFLNKVVIPVTTTHGPAKFSKDNWATEQSSNTFHNLVDGTAIQIKDALNCTASVIIAIPQAPINQIYFSRNPVWYTIPQNNLVPGTEIVLQLWSESAHYQQDYKLIISRSRPVLADGTCIFDLNEVLNTLVSQSPEVPELAQNTSQVLSKCILNYYLAYAILNPETGAPGEFMASNLFTVIKGGLPLEHFAAVDFFGAYQDSKKQFLSWSRKIRRVSYNQKEYLYFLNLENRDTLKIRRKYYTAASATPVAVDEELILTNGLHRLIQVPVLANAAEQLTKLEILVLDSNNLPVSEQRTYLVTSELQERFYLYENSLGGFDTLRATGETDISLDSKDEVAEQMLLPNQTGTQGQLYVVSNQVERKIKQSTGLHSPEDHLELQEFVFARNRYEIIGNKLFPIILGKRAYVHEIGQKKPVGYAFEYNYAFNLTAYANFR